MQYESSFQVRDIIKTNRDAFNWNKYYVISFVSTVIFIIICGLYLSTTISPLKRQHLIVSTSQAPAVARGNGKIISSLSQVLSTPEAGIIKTIYAYQGQEVQVGAPLIEINNPSLYREFKEIEFEANDIVAEIAYQQSELTLDLLKFEADLDKAKSISEGFQLEMSASKHLANSGVVSKIKFEQLALSSHQAKREVESLERRLKLFKDNIQQQKDALVARKHAALNKVSYFQKRIDSLTITAPFTGIVKELSFSQGESVSDGTGLLEIVDHKTLSAEITIPQYAGHKVRQSNSVVIKTPSGKIDGVVEFVDPVVRQGATLVRVSLPSNPPDWINLAQSVEAEINTSATTELSYVTKPHDYLDTESWQVYQVTDGEMKATEIKIIRSDNNHLYLQPGLEQGTEIVLVSHSGQHPSLP
jgi:multidrug resistance efflux pump